ncbi:MAG TPA: hypothetical protein VGC54_06285 [Planctomycetota bacterium]
MLLKLATLERIKAGEVSLAFRKWKRPTVRAGGSLKTRLGVLGIDAVERASLASITAAQARKAGYATRADLVAELQKRGEGDLHRVALHWQGADPRSVLRAKTAFSAAERDAMLARLARLDAASRGGAWTRAYLRTIADRPATLAATLAEAQGIDKPRFKQRVRRLKEMGLTESLGVGYRLSPRGKKVLAHLERR